MNSTKLAISVLEENIINILKDSSGIQAGKIGELIGLPDMHDYTGNWPKGDAGRSFTAMLLGNMHRKGVVSVHKDGNDTIYKVRK